MAKYTPMIEQYLTIKADAADAFLFFRLGDFYELFFEDAVKAARELDITLTGREGGAAEKIPMCGVPHHSAEQYITRLIQKGYKVAICDQVEDPAEAKGVVRREIVRIITPGTVMDGKTLGESANNFMVCLTQMDSCYALASCDLTTGELYQTEIDTSIGHLLDEAMVYTPSELIVDSSLYAAVQQEASAWPRSVLITEWQKSGSVNLTDHFTQDKVNALSVIGQRCISLLMSYLYETQKRALSHITAIQVYQPKQYMTLDPFTRRNLELVETVRERARKGSLLWLLDKSVTSMGARLLRRWIDKPLMQKDEIEARLEAVDMLYNQLIVREEMRQQLKEVYDLERLVGRISFGNANARDLTALKISLNQVPLLLQTCLQANSTTLHQLVENLDDCADVMEWIEEAIIEDPPVSIKDGGIIKDGYHDHLDQLREASVHGKRWIAELEKQEREQTGIKSLKIGFNKVFGYYIEVTKANIAALPEGRYERKQTLSNAERYITPELKEKEALILEAEEKMVYIEHDLFLQLRERIAGHIPRLQKLAEIIAVMDVYQSLAAVSAANHYCRPVLTEAYELQIEAGRHPVVEAVMKDTSFIANNSLMTEEDQRMLLITGPNMAGKSTYMRQVALINIMAQIGCFVPADTAVIPIVDRIFTRIGAADDLIGGQSTFMVEMMDIQIMTEKATDRSLVIIDELGRGTSTGEGMAIAQAVIEYLHNEVGCKTLVSTHFHELAHLEESLQYLRNYCMAVKESGEQVTFLRKLIPGSASTSYGIYCAQIAGIPESIIERSYRLLNHFESRAALQQNALETGASESDPAAVYQLNMFDHIERPKKADKSPKDKKAEQMMEQIRGADLMNMTPLEAMNFIHQLKQNI
jgi:DNA mismatch repair protein MutS